MAVPDFLSSAFRATQYVAVTDVNTIIAALNTELVTNGVWTDTGGTGVGPFKSVPNALDGSYIIITVARISATRISYVIKDHLGLMVNEMSNPYLSTTQDIDSGITVGIYSGPNHVCVETYRATPETWYAVRLNVWPDTPGQVRTSFVSSFGPRDTNGSTLSKTIDAIWNRALADLVYGTNVMTVPHSSYLTNNLKLYSPSGAYIFVPVEIVDSASSVFLGRYPQMLMGPTNLIQGSTYTVPIDVGVTGTFRVLYLSTMTNHSRFIAIRTA